MGEQIHKRLSKEFVEEILRSFTEHKVSEKQACEILGLKRARLYRLRDTWLKESEKGEFQLYHRASIPTHHFPEEVEKFLHEQLNYIKNDAKKFRSKFNFAFLSEEAEKEFDKKFHRDSIRRFALRHGYYKGSSEEKQKVFTRFETPGPGFLFQHDTSRHIWVPLTRSYYDLIMTEDDYSRKIVGGELFERENTWAHFKVARTTVEEVGRAMGYYVDNHSIFRFVEHRGLHVEYKCRADEGEIQFKRALKMLDINLIYAPQGQAEAKGKIEKRFDYFQRRLPFLCEKYHITAIPTANKILKEELIPYYNEKRIHDDTGEIPYERWNRAIRAGKGYIRRLLKNHDLNFIFSLHYDRRVKKDGTITFAGQPFKVGCHPGQLVTVSYLPGMKIRIYKGNHKLWEYYL